MRSTLKKTIAAITAAALAAGTLAVLPPITKAADSGQKFEFESGTLEGKAAVQKSGTERYQKGASGDSFVFVEDATSSVTVPVKVDKAGQYEVYINYSAPFGNKTNVLKVNGQGQGNIQNAETAEGEWKELDAGTVKLNAGENTITIAGSWGWADFDYVRLEPAVTPDVVATDKLLSDGKATASTKGLFAYMNSVYGKKVITGQQEYYNTSRDDEFNYISDTTGGKLPALRGFDLGNTDPLYKNDDGAVKRMISWVNDKGGIAETSWHVNVPKSMADYTPGKTMDWDKTTYSEKTDFVTSNCWKKGTKEYEFFEDAVKNLAEALQQLSDADVPVLFRPFHEASGGGATDGSSAWFWWAKDGAQVYKYLYQYLHDKLTNEYGLHNLIWLFNSYPVDSDKTAWYPGDDFVDIVGLDIYRYNNGVIDDSSLASSFFKLIKMYDNKKMISLIECDTMPSAANIKADGAYWGYMMPWYDNHLMQANDKATLKALYNSDIAVTLSDLPEYKKTEAPTETKAPTVTDKAPDITTTTEFKTDVKDAVVGKVDKKGNLTFDKAIGDSTVNVKLNIADSNIASANGGFGVSCEVNGIYYWVNFQWEKGSSDTVSFKLDDPLNITYENGTKEVASTDALFKQVVEKAKQTTTGQFQCWYAGDAKGEKLKSSDITPAGTYLTNGESQPKTTTTTKKAVTTKPEETTKAPEKTTKTDVVTPEGYKSVEDILADMGAGWNYGNSLDATNGAKAKAGDISAETAWGNAAATQATFDAIKARGFKSVRIPVTWYEHLDENYKIDEAWLNRVQEVVDYAYKDGLYIILNCHHEDFIENKNIGTDYDKISKELTTVWSQLADRFKDYDQHLIFEGMNEPRAKDTDHEWWGPQQSEIDTINKLNADFVKTVRAEGSANNKNRILMVTPYCASSDVTMFSKLIVPDDPYVVVSIHGYLPYTLCMDASVTDHSKFTDADKASLESVFNNIRKTFLDKGIRVIIGEYGSSDFDSNVEARTACESYYVGLGKKYGIPMFLWDNNSVGTTGGEHHYYLKRGTNTPEAELNKWYDESAPIIDGILGVMSDDSIVWNSEGQSPVVKHKDLTSGKKLFEGSQELDGSVKNGNCSENFDFTFDSIKGKELAVKFTGETPKVAMMDAAWNNWSDLDPYDVVDGVAYYSEDAIKKAWKGGEDGPAHVCVAIYSGKTTLTGVYLIDAATVEKPIVTTKPTTKPQETTTTTTTTVTTTKKPVETDNPETTTTGKKIKFIEQTMNGDVNNDGTRNISDAILLNKYIAGNAELTDVQMSNANLNHDDYITIDDSVYLLKALVLLLPF